MKPDPERPDVALCVDVLAPEGYGEIIGGGERLDDYDLLLAAHQGAQPAAGSVRVVPGSPPLRQRAARRIRHGHRARRELDLRPRAPARSDSRIRGCCTGFIRETVYQLGGSRTAPTTNEDRFFSLGCPKNLVDGEVMLGIARDAGHEITTEAAERRRARREHLRVHRLGQAGVDRRHPRDGRSTSATAAARAWSSPAASPSATATSCEGRSPRSTPCSAPGRSTEIVGAIGARELRGSGARGVARSRLSRSHSQASPPTSRARTARAPEPASSRHSRHISTTPTPLAC